MQLCTGSQLPPPHQTKVQTGVHIEQIGQKPDWQKQADLLPDFPTCNHHHLLLLKHLPTIQQDRKTVNQFREYIRPFLGPSMHGPEHSANLCLAQQAEIDTIAPSVTFERYLENRVFSLQSWNLFIFKPNSLIPSH